MASAVPERTSETPRGSQRSWPGLRDVPDRAETEAARIIGPAAVESLKPAFDDDEEDTAVIRVELQTKRAEIERLCREFTAEK